MTQNLVVWVGALNTSRWVIIIIVLACIPGPGIVHGSGRDPGADCAGRLPLVRSLGFDLIWFGVIKIVMAEIGLITPPIGLNCFIVARYGNRRVSDVFGGIRPHFLAHLVAIAILVAFPGIVLWLPSRM